MYKINLRLGLLFIGGVLLLILAQAALCEANSDSRYLKIAGNANYTYYLDKKTVRYINPYPGEVFIDAWIKIVCTNGDPKTEIENRLSKNLSVKGYENFGYSVRRYYFRLKDRQMQMLDLRDFTVDGAILDSKQYPFTSKRWDDIAPTTLGEVWYEKILAYIKNNPN